MKIFAVLGKFSRDYQRVFFTEEELDRWLNDYGDSCTSYVEYDVPDPDVEEKPCVWGVTFDLNTDELVKLYRGCSKDKSGKKETWPRKYPFRVTFYVDALTNREALREALASFKAFKEEVGDSFVTSPSAS